MSVFSSVGTGILIGRYAIKEILPNDHKQDSENRKMGDPKALLTLKPERYTERQTEREKNTFSALINIKVMTKI